MTRVFACLISEGRAFHCLGIEPENELSSLVLQLNFGTVSKMERYFHEIGEIWIDGTCRFKNAERLDGTLKLIANKARQLCL